MTEKEYRDLPHVSYSILASLDKSGPKSLVYSEDISTQPAIVRGNAVEELVQGTKESFDELFQVVKYSKPSHHLGKLVDAMLETNTPIDKEAAFKLAKSIPLWKGTTNETAYYNQFDKEEFWGYLNQIKEGNGRIQITEEKFDEYKVMAESVLNSKYTKHVWREGEGIENLNQLTILWNLDQIKSKLDWVKIDHNKKIIYPYDLKTSSFKKEEFIDRFYKNRYYIQASMYTDALLQWMTFKYPDYKLDNFRFVVVSELDPTNPIIYRISDTKIEEGRDGFYNRDGKLVRKGWTNLYDDYLWYKKNKCFDYNKEVYENNGEILI